MFVGDVSLGEYYMSFGHGPRTFANSQQIFANVNSLLESADMVVGNLEAPITGLNYDLNEPESIVLKADPSHADQLRDAGFRLMQVANNHTVQHGDGGFDETLQALEKNGISPVGLNQQKPVTIEREGLRIGFMAASDVPDNTDTSQHRYQRLDESFLVNVEAEVKNHDHFVVMFHWGLEASTAPLPYQREIVDRLFKAGVSAVIGSHPHLFYEIEKRDGFICAYSLGNFVFDLCWDNRLIKTGILEVDFLREGITARYWPAVIEENGCLPTLSGKPVSIDRTIVPYNLGSKMELQQIRKIAYLMRNFHRGHTLLKARFFYRKLGGLFRAAEKHG
jgi:poly-gamma-glutamate synthesis protein (capsule biosynthesis protein)